MKVWALLVFGSLFGLGSGNAMRVGDDNYYLKRQKRLRDDAKNKLRQSLDKFQPPSQLAALMRNYHMYQAAVKGRHVEDAGLTIRASEFAVRGLLTWGARKANLLRLVYGFDGVLVRFGKREALAATFVNYFVAGPLLERRKRWGKKLGAKLRFFAEEEAFIPFDGDLSNKESRLILKIVAKALRYDVGYVFSRFKMPRHKESLRDEDPGIEFYVGEYDERLHLFIDFSPESDNDQMEVQERPPLVPMMA